MYLKLVLFFRNRKESFDLQNFQQLQGIIILKERPEEIAKKELWKQPEKIILLRLNVLRRIVSHNVQIEIFACISFDRHAEFCSFTISFLCKNWWIFHKVEPIRFKTILFHFIRSPTQLPLLLLS